MGIAAFGVYKLAGAFVGTASWSRNAICTVCAIGIAVIVYFVCVIAIRAITLEDMKLIPGGEKVGKLLHIH